jgi:hypothetical protein
MIRSGSERGNRAGQFGPQYLILGGKVFVAQQKFLVDGAGHVSQKSYPSAVPHSASILLCCRSFEYFYYTDIYFGYLPTNQPSGSMKLSAFIGTDLRKV